MAAQRRERLGAPDQEPGLRAAEQLVAAEGDEVGAGGDALLHRGFVRAADAAQVEQRAAAEILDEQQAARAGERAELGERRPIG